MRTIPAMSIPPDELQPADVPFNLRFTDRGDYLYGVVDGAQGTLETTLAYWREIAAECVRRGTTQLLICDDLVGAPASPQDFARLANDLRGSGLEHVRIAFHEPVSDNLRLVEHGELAFREAGFTLRVFGSEGEAELWLRYGQA